MVFLQWAARVSGEDGDASGRMSHEMVHGAAELDANLRSRLCLKIGRSSVRAAVATRESDAPQKSNVKLRDIAAHVVTQSNEPRHVMGASGGTSPATVDPAHSAALRRRR